MTVTKIRKPPGPKPVHQALIQIRLPPELKQAALLKAAEEGTALSDVVRRLLVEWLKS